MLKPLSDGCECIARCARTRTLVSRIILHNMYEILLASRNSYVGDLRLDWKYNIFDMTEVNGDIK